MVDADILCKICGKCGIVLAVRMRKGAPAYLGYHTEVLGTRILCLTPILGIYGICFKKIHVIHVIRGFLGARGMCF